MGNMNRPVTIPELPGTMKNIIKRPATAAGPLIIIRATEVCRLIPLSCISGRICMDRPMEVNQWMLQATARNQKVRVRMMAPTGEGSRTAPALPRSPEPPLVPRRMIALTQTGPSTCTPACTMSE